MTEERSSTPPAAVPSLPARPPAATLHAAPRLAPGLLIAGIAAQMQAAGLADVADGAPAPATHARVSAPRTRPALFTNPIARGADPWVTRRNGTYYYCEPVQDRFIAVYTSDRLTHRGPRTIVWAAPQRAWNSHLVWAPELHWLDGRWYIYYTAAAGPRDNTSHRVGVLESTTEDALGPYRDCGVVYTGDDPGGMRDNRWAIDATVLEWRGERYLLWSGWPGERDVQYLYIAPLATPSRTAGPRVRLCDNATYVWERVGDNPRARGLHEGPQVLQHAGRLFIVYSCSSSWQPTYKLGLLELIPGGDPLCAAHWRKQPRPVFESTHTVFGVGHACFVKSPDNREDWIVYHAKLSRSAGWERAVCMQRFGWRPDGLPDFGQPLPWGTSIAAPAGELAGQRSRHEGRHRARPRNARATV